MDLKNIGEINLNCNLQTLLFNTI